MNQNHCISNYFSKPKIHDEAKTYNRPLKHNVENHKYSLIKGLVSILNL